MTNGEKIEEIFPNLETIPNPYSPSIDIGVGGIMMMRVDRNWWDAEYKEPRKGHWINTNNHHYYNDGDIETTELRCSCCNEEVEWDIELLHKPYYCENCGAKMIEPQESEDKG